VVRVVRDDHSSLAFPTWPFIRIARADRRVLRKTLM
jgi:hypothetical protein